MLTLTVPEVGLFALLIALCQPKLEILLDEISSSGLRAVTNTEQYHVQIPKERWYAMLRARFMSNLAGFTPDEIEDGILKVDSQPDGDGGCFTDSLFFVVIEHEPE